MVLAAGLMLVHRQSREEPAIQSAEPGSIANKDQRIAECDPENRYQRDRSKALHHGPEHVLLSHHAGIEQREPRNRHHQDQCRRNHHPRGVGAADVGRCGESRCCKRTAERKTSWRSQLHCATQTCPHLIFPHPDRIFFANPGRHCPGAIDVLSELECVAVGFAGANSQGVIDRRHENLAVANLSGARARRNDIDRLVGDVGCDGDLDP